MKRLLLILILVTTLSSGFAKGLGYAFSGGGARGFAHIGILKVLEEEGLKPDYISGTSIGAVIGAFYSMGYTAAEVESLALAFNWNSLLQDGIQRRDLYVGQKRWAPFGNIILELDEGWSPQLPSSLYRANNLNLELFRVYAPASNYRNFRDLPIPFTCVATNLLTGEAEVFQHGSLMQAVRASLSVPSLMMPFEIGDQLYIDGGISRNLPITELREMGAEQIIGFKVNSSLRTSDDLGSLIDVLDQTINIGMTRNLSLELVDCDLLLEPDLLDYTSQDFKYVKEIIEIGERYAREHIGSIRDFVQRSQAQEHGDLPRFHEDVKYDIVKLDVVGNNRISYAKIKEYLGMEIPGYYSVEDIYNAARRVLNSQYFNVLYPELEPLGNSGFVLRVHLKERQPKILALNNAYNDEVKLTASAILSIDNQLLKNSRLLAQIVLGGKNELNVDYVKNFGEFWGIYYRIFSYANEKTIYAYNADHHQVNSSKSLEWGATSGIGLFTRHNIISEAFVYYSNTSIYRGISESDMPSRFNSVSGFGAKLYYESLDDYSFPKRGVMANMKLNFARDEDYSDFIYSSLRGKFEAHVPIVHNLSVILGMQIGTYFDVNEGQEFDPFAIGGMDGFKGYSRYEINAPHYRVMQFGISSTLGKLMNVQLGVQGLTYDDNEFIGNRISDEFCYYMGVGMKAFTLPIRVQIALNERNEINTMFSIGNDWDIFHFSRK